MFVSVKPSESRIKEWSRVHRLTTVTANSSSVDAGPPRNLVTSEVTDTSFAASWTAAPGNVKTYRIRWKSLFSAETGAKTVPGHVTSTVLEGLTPETLYQVSVVAEYGHKDSAPLTGEETTDGKKHGHKNHVGQV